MRTTGVVGVIFMLGSLLVEIKLKKVVVKIAVCEAFVTVLFGGIAWAE